MDLKDDVRLQKIMREYFNLDKIISVVAYGKSFVNEKYLITMPEAEYILQRINTRLYNSPFGVVHNIDLVTNRIKQNLIYRGEDCYSSLITPIPNRYDELMTIVDDEYWRCTNKIDNTTVHYEITDEKMIYSIGELIGNFQVLLDGFNANLLDSSIPTAHDLKYMYTHLLEVYKLNPANRAKDCEKEIKYLKTKKCQLTLISNKLDNKLIPYRVSHNGATISEIVFDNETKEALTFLNMDAVMKGACGYDLGVALRQCTTTFNKIDGEEKATINFEYLESLLEGYYGKAKIILTENEKNSLYDSYYTMVLEASILHLSEYLEGNHISILEYPEQNFDRAKRQIALLKEIEINEEKIKAIFKRVLE